MQVSSIKCPACGDVIYSRTRHDMHYCSCGAVAIDGGRDYVKISAKPEIEIQSIRVEQIEVDATEQDLYDDWNNRTNKFGTIKAKA